MKWRDGQSIILKVYLDSFSSVIPSLKHGLIWINKNSYLSSKIVRKEPIDLINEANIVLPPGVLIKGI